MNAFKFSSLLALGAALSLVATGCKHNPPPITHIGRNGEGITGGPNDNLNNGVALNNGPGTGAGQVGGGDLPNFDPDQMQQDRTAFAADIVYFDYDSSAIKSSEQSKLSAIASALQADASAKLLIEGNCDERGTEEYNRSLGERRALAAREGLANLGVDSSRIATRSYGEDRPSDPGHTQAAWGKNRRDEFVLLHAK
jgi:peptidoglycan-associated lipoprotein